MKSSKFEFIGNGDAYSDTHTKASPKQRVSLYSAIDFRTRSKAYLGTERHMDTRSNDKGSIYDMDTIIGSSKSRCASQSPRSPNIKHSKTCDSYSSNSEFNGRVSPERIDRISKTKRRVCRNERRSRFYHRSRFPIGSRSHTAIPQIRFWDGISVEKSHASTQPGSVNILGGEHISLILVYASHQIELLIRCLEVEKCCFGIHPVKDKYREWQLCISVRGLTFLIHKRLPVDLLVKLGNVLKNCSMKAPLVTPSGSLELLVGKSRISPMNVCQTISCYIQGTSAKDEYLTEARTILDNMLKQNGKLTLADLTKQFTGVDMDYASEYYLKLREDLPFHLIMCTHYAREIFLQFGAMIDHPKGDRDSKISKVSEEQHQVNMKRKDYEFRNCGLCSRILQSPDSPGNSGVYNDLNKFPSRARLYRAKELLSLFQNLLISSIPHISDMDFDSDISGSVGYTGNHTVPQNEFSRSDYTGVIVKQGIDRYNAKYDINKRGGTPVAHNNTREIYYANRHDRTETSENFISHYNIYPFNGTHNRQNVGSLCSTSPVGFGVAGSSLRSREVNHVNPPLNKWNSVPTLYHMDNTLLPYIYTNDKQFIPRPPEYLTNVR